MNSKCQIPNVKFQMSNEFQSSKCRNSALSGLTIIKAKGLSYSIWALDLI
jgi:hypothetical protein